MKFTPLYDRLLVKRCEAEAYQGMIEIPDSAKEKPMEGLVLAVGSGRYNDAGNLMPMSVKDGDRILLGKYAGTEIKINGEDLLILREDEVMGVLRDDQLEALQETLKSVPLHVREEGDPSFPTGHELAPQPAPESAEAFLAELRKEAGGKDDE